MTKTGDETVDSMFDEIKTVSVRTAVTIKLSKSR